MNRSLGLASTGRLLLMCTVTLLGPPLLMAQEDAQPDAADTNVSIYYERLARQVKPSLAWNATTPQEHQAWRKQMQATVVDLLGKMPDPVPLQVKWTEKQEFEKFTRHKIYVQTEKNYWSPVYYFVPKQVEGKRPAVVCLHGHSGINPYIRLEETPAQKKNTDEHDLDYAVYLAEHGYVTAAIVVRGWNETCGRQDRIVKSPPRSCHEVTMNAFLMGMTPQGIRCWDAMRVIDFLQSQEVVDGEKIAVAGLSGGGTLSMYLPIVDQRVGLVMIGGAFSEYRTSIYAMNHCICNCLPGIMRVAEMADVVALVAPRPVLLINGTNDPIFPIEGARKGFGQLQQVYSVLGVKDHVDADFFPGEHSWSHTKTVPFLRKHFGS